MVFRFFRRKETPKQLPPPDLEECVLLLGSEEQLPSTQLSPKFSHVYEEGKSSQTQENRSFFNVLTSPSAKEIIFEGRTFHLENIALGGKPTRNFVLGHPLKPISFYSKWSNDSDIMPLGVLYFSESLPLNDLLVYRVQCIMHEIFNMNNNATNTEYICHDDDSIALDPNKFLDRLKRSLKDLASAMTGSELRVYK